MASPVDWSSRLRRQILIGDVWPGKRGRGYSDGVRGLFERSGRARKTTLALAAVLLLSDHDLRVRTGAVVLLERMGGVLGEARIERLIDANRDALAGVLGDPDDSEFRGADLLEPLTRLLASLSR